MTRSKQVMWVKIPSSFMHHHIALSKGLHPGHGCLQMKGKHHYYIQVIEDIVAVPCMGLPSTGPRWEPEDVSMVQRTQECPNLPNLLPLPQVPKGARPRNNSPWETQSSSHTSANNVTKFWGQFFHLLGLIITHICITVPGPGVSQAGSE